MLLAATSPLASGSYVVAILVGVIAIAAACLLGFFFLKGSLGTSVTTLQKANAEALELQNKILTDKVNELTTQVGAQKEQIQLLTELVTNRAAIEELKTTLNNNFARIMEVLNK